MDSRAATPDLFEYTNYRSYLADYFADQKKKNSGFSTRAWCKRLALKSPATLNMILRGHRNPSAKLVDDFTRYFRFSNRQKEYFEALVRLAKVEGESDESLRFMETLRKIHPTKEFKLLDYDCFAAISTWYCFAIREMVSWANFVNDPAWIARRLTGRISPKKLAEAIDLLIRVGLISQNAKGQLKAQDQHISTLADHANEAVKRFHEQILTLAQESIRSVAVDERDFGGSTFNMDPKDLPALKEELRRTRNEIYRRFEKPKAEMTYQMSFIIFPLTKKPEETP